MLVFQSLLKLLCPFPLLASAFICITFVALREFPQNPKDKSSAKRNHQSIFCVHQEPPCKAPISQGQT